MKLKKGNNGHKIHRPDKTDSSKSIAAERLSIGVRVPTDSGVQIRTGNQASKAFHFLMKMAYIVMAAKNTPYNII